MTRDGTECVLCANDGDDGARPIATDPHLIAKGVPRDRPAGCRAVPGVEFPREQVGLGGVSIQALAIWVALGDRWLRFGCVPAVGVLSCVACGMI
jgi:hypothetical protein